MSIKFIKKILGLSIIAFMFYAIIFSNKTYAEDSELDFNNPYLKITVYDPDTDTFNKYIYTPTSQPEEGIDGLSVYVGGSTATLTVGYGKTVNIDVLLDSDREKTVFSTNCLFNVQGYGTLNLIFHSSPKEGPVNSDVILFNTDVSVENSEKSGMSQMYVGRYNNTVINTIYKLDEDDTRNYDSYTGFKSAWLIIEGASINLVNAKNFADVVASYEWNIKCTKSSISLSYSIDEIIHNPLITTGRKFGLDNCSLKIIYPCYKAHSNGSEVLGDPKSYYEPLIDVGCFYALNSYVYLDCGIYKQGIYASNPWHDTNFDGLNFKNSEIIIKSHRELDPYNSFNSLHFGNNMLPGASLISLPKNGSDSSIQITDSIFELDTISFGMVAPQITINESNYNYGGYVTNKSATIKALKDNGFYEHEDIKNTGLLCREKLSPTLDSTITAQSALFGARYYGDDVNSLQTNFITLNKNVDDSNFRQKYYFNDFLIPRKYRVRFDACESINIKGTLENQYFDIDSSDKVSKPSEDPFYHGHKFLGWYDESGNLYDFNSTVKSDLILSAKFGQIFEIIIDTNSYGLITFSVAEGDNEVIDYYPVSIYGSDLLGYFDQNNVLVINPDGSFNPSCPYVDSNGLWNYDTSLNPLTLTAKFATYIDVPLPNINITYNGEYRIGVDGGIGYTISNNVQCDAGDYEAIVSLEEGYVWSDGSVDDKTIAYTIHPLDISDGQVSIETYGDYIGESIEPAVLSISINDIDFDLDNFSIDYANTVFYDDDLLVSRIARVVITPANDNFTNTLYRYYEIDRKLYNIEYSNVEGVSNPNPYEYYYGMLYPLFEPGNKEGYIFDGWYLGDEKISEIPSKINDDLTIYARYVKDSYNVIVDLNDDLTSPAEITTVLVDGKLKVNYGSSFELLNPTRKGYDFAGWTITGIHEHSSPIYISGDVEKPLNVFTGIKETKYKNLTIEGDVTFTASWKKEGQGGHGGNGSYYIPLTGIR